MATGTLGAKERPFVESLAHLVARTGMPAAAGKVLGYLIIAEPGCQTSDEIAAALGEETALVDAIADGLYHSGVLDRVDLPRQAVPCYAVKPWSEVLEARLGQLHEMQRIVEAGLDALGEDRPNARRRLLELRELYGWLEQDLRPMMARLHSAQKP